MIPRTSVTSPTNISTDPYFNEARYVGKGGYYRGNSSYQCVNYAIGRTCEISGKAVCYYSGISTKSQIEKPMMNRSGYGNAINWWNDTLWQKGSEPRLGAVMVYGKNYGGGYGHVRVVEKIDGDKIYYSGANESNRMAFAWINKPSITSGGFLGYIYNPFVGGTTNEELTERIQELEAQVNQAEELLAKANKKISTYALLLNEIRSIVNENGGL